MLPRPTPTPTGPGQESVWDYPRPPRLESTGELVEVRIGERCVAQTNRALRVLETSHPPTYYLPRSAFVDGSLEPVSGTSFCEWKGRAAYFDVLGGDVRAGAAAWTYPAPSPGFEALVDHVAVMPGEMDLCLVDGERVRPQEGGFYGGWITDRVVGPFKGGPGSQWW